MSVDGLILIDKPSGMTSHDVVAKIRRTLSPGKSFRKQIKCGHTGTLDPMATGLMLVLCGRATRLSKYLIGLDKTYDAEVTFGSETDSLDSEGETIGIADVTCTESELIDTALSFVGKQMQVPPQISALKINGKRYCDRVRAGEDVGDPDSREISIYKIDCKIVDWDSDSNNFQADINIHCSSGTYVRSLARDIAIKLGTKGHLSKLRRGAVANFSVSDALPAVEIEDRGQLLEALVPMNEALSWMPHIDISDSEVLAFRVGNQPSPDFIERITDSEQVVQAKNAGIRAVNSEGDLISVLQKTEDGKALKLDIVIPEQRLEKS